MIIRVLLFLIFIFAGTENTMAELKICEEGITKCEPLVNSKEKYMRCMKLSCYEDTKKEITKNKSKLFTFVKANYTGKPFVRVTACNYGKKKCDSLIDNSEFYWECMYQMCKAPPQNPNDKCKEGLKLCTPENKKFTSCVDSYCKGDFATDKNYCDLGQKNCSFYLRKYWRCVYGVCLGSADEFKAPTETQKYVVYKDEKGEFEFKVLDEIQPLAVGMPPAFLQIPDGIDASEWIKDTPQKYLAIDNPADALMCTNKGAMLRCDSKDLRACYCTDGNEPVFKYGTPAPDYVIKNGLKKEKK